MKDNTNYKYRISYENEYLKSLGVELFPAPRGGTVSTENAITVDRAELVSYIESKSVTFSPNTTDPTVDPNAPVTQDGSIVQ